MQIHSAGRAAGHQDQKAVRKTLEQAIRHHDWVSIRYHKDDEVSPHVVIPTSLKSSSQGNQLLKACEADDSSLRSFRLDRIESAEILPQPTADPKPLLRSLMEAIDDGKTITILYDAPQAGTVEKEIVPDGLVFQPDHTVAVEAHFPGGEKSYNFRLDRIEGWQVA